MLKCKLASFFILRLKFSLVIFLILILTSTLKPIFAQQSEDQSYNGKTIEEIRDIRDRHKTELLRIPGVRNITTLWDQGQITFNVITDKTVDRNKIPATLEGILVLVTTEDDSPFFLDKDQEKVKAVQIKHEDELFKNAGVVAIGIGELNGEAVLRVFVEEEDHLQNLPKEIEGIKVAPFISGKLYKYDTCDPFSSPCDHRLPYNFPVPMGVSTWNNQSCAAGTLGFKVCDGLYGTIGYITNNHVAADTPTGCPNIGFPAFQYQPGPFDANCGLVTNIGQLSRYL